MEVVKKSALLPYYASQIYDLVKDIERYPEFLPWCSGAQVLEVLDNGVVGSVEINKGVVRKTFTTRNYFEKNRKITMRLVSGPFNHLQGWWIFDPVNESGCRVSLDLEFGFSNTLAKLTIGPIFKSIADKLLDAFVAEANRLYG